MNKQWFILIAGLSLVAALLACSNSTSSDPSVAGRATALAQTAAALLTSTAAASITPVTPTDTAAPPTPTTAATATATRAPVTNTPVPTITATPCGTEDSDFVSDVTIPDGTHVKLGAAFTKTWRLRNSGQCAWTTGYTLRNVGGEVMAGATLNLPNGVPPGATVDLSVAFVAPTDAGKHISRWQLFTPDGTAFGTKPFLQIAVP